MIGHRWVGAKIKEYSYHAVTQEKNLFVLNQTLRSFEVIEPQLTLRDLVPGLHEKCTEFMIDMGLNISYFSGRKKTRRNIDEHANELELW